MYTYIDDLSIRKCYGPVLFIILEKHDKRQILVHTTSRKYCENELLICFQHEKKCENKKIVMSELYADKELITLYLIMIYYYLLCSCFGH